MTAILSLLVIVTVSILVTRIAAVALTLTGLAHPVAQFQARSAFTGVGFTTGEAEKVVNHPVRRRIIEHLMFLGNVGIVSAMSSLVLSFVGQEQESLTPRLAALAGGLVVLWLLSRSRWLEGVIERIITWVLERTTELRVLDYAELLHLQDEFEVTELTIREEDWLADKQLGELRLRQEGVVVLGIQRSEGNYLAAPRGETWIRAGDRLILYGPGDCIRELDERTCGAEGDAAHERAVTQESHRRAREKVEDRTQDSFEQARTARHEN